MLGAMKKTGTRSFFIPSATHKEEKLTIKNPPITQVLRRRRNHFNLHILVIVCFGGLVHYLATTSAPHDNWIPDCDRGGRIQHTKRGGKQKNKHFFFIVSPPHKPPLFCYKHAHFATKQSKRSATSEACSSRVRT